MKKSLFILGAVIIGSSFAGCGSGSGSGSSVSYGPLAGTWRATALNGGGDDIPCPARIAAGGTTGIMGEVPQFSCGDADTFTFQPDGTFTTTPGYAGPATSLAVFSGRWTQFQSRATLTVDGSSNAAFPYGTEIFFRRENQFTTLVPGQPSLNRYVFTRQ